ncbi:MAG: methionyl-tRNA formyltransferase [Saccharopolyspora sp.]|uniref:methionyl-tRNA formyltransferase n=1 Tax=Saccharopolyspora sp. TaxID=33915 RepID=UPI0025D1F3FA|nr:methionyl-tRNA formyltransferase [Saccharopolyspora sp.]MBQ6639701.1 methionyl-tRNA formyltransferase [Saccharopolyspora sp.]
MRVVFAGTPEAAVPSLRALLESGRHEVAAVITRPDARSGRGRKVLRSPVGAVADEHGLEVLTPERASDPEFLERLRELAPDCCPVVAYGALLKRAALEIPRHGWINLHFSLLPAWRGAAPVQAAIRHGDDMTGASAFRLVPELDAGPVYGVVTEDVRAGDTSGVLLDRLAESGAKLLLATLDGIEDGSLRAEEQPAEGISYAPKVSVDDAKVDFTRPAHVVDRVIRSVTPDPGAWAFFGDERLKLGAVSVTEETGLAPGELRVEKRRVLVGTGTAAVALGEVQAQGKKRMAATDWARGTRIEQGEVLK